MCPLPHFLVLYKHVAHVCPCQQRVTILDNLHVPNPTRCSCWCQKLHTEKGIEWQCYHHEIITPSKITEMETKLESLKWMLLVCINEIIVWSKKKFKNVDIIQGKSEFKPNSYPRPYKRNKALQPTYLQVSFFSDSYQPWRPIWQLAESDSEKMHCKERDIFALWKKIEHGTPNDENALFYLFNLYYVYHYYTAQTMST
jgi:hypothetical protein